MRIAPALVAFAIASCTLAMLSQAQQRAAGTKAAKAAPENSSRRSDENAIRQAGEAFAAAYNAHDPRAIAALFAPDGELVDPEGSAEMGRAAIERVFGAVFGEYPEAAMTIAIESIRFPSANLAVEDGVATVAHEPEGQVEPNRYTATHLKHADGKWLLASVRDLENKTETAAGELEQLAWLIGDWIDESPDSLVVTSYRWTENHCYITSEFSIRVAGKPVLTGSQRIGWDPLAKVIRNWVFDSEGGFAAGVFSRDGNRWIVKQTGVARDGQPVSATNTITALSNDRFSWESRDRMMGGAPLAEVEPVTVVRKPPRPGS